VGEGVTSATGTEYRRAARRVTREVGCTIFVFAPPPFPRPLFVRYVMYATQSYFRPVVRRSWRILYALLCRIAT